MAAITYFCLALLASAPISFQAWTCSANAAYLLADHFIFSRILAHRDAASRVCALSSFFNYASPPRVCISSQFVSIARTRVSCCLTAYFAFARMHLASRLISVARHRACSGLPSSCMRRVRAHASHRRVRQRHVRAAASALCNLRTRARRPRISPHVICLCMHGASARMPYTDTLG